MGDGKSRSKNSTSQERMPENHELTAIVKAHRPAENRKMAKLNEERRSNRGYRQNCGTYRAHMSTKLNAYEVGKRFRRVCLAVWQRPHIVKFSGWHLTVRNTSASARFTALFCNASQKLLMRLMFAICGALLQRVAVLIHKQTVDFQERTEHMI